MEGLGRFGRLCTHDRKRAGAEGSLRTSSLLGKRASLRVLVARTSEAVLLSRMHVLARTLHIPRCEPLSPIGRPCRKWPGMQNGRPLTKAETDCSGAVHVWFCYSDMEFAK